MEYLAILSNENYLEKILNGTKIIESRFSKNKILPYNQLKENDIVYLKVTGKKEIKARFKVEDIKYFEQLNPQKMLELEKMYGKEINASSEYWQLKKHANYGTLIWVKEAQKIEPIIFQKKNRSAFLKFEISSK